MLNLIANFINSLTIWISNSNELLIKEIFRQVK